MHVPACITVNSLCFLWPLTVRVEQFPCHWTKYSDGSYHLHRDLMLLLFLSALPLMMSPPFLCHSSLWLE